MQRPTLTNIRVRSTRDALHVFTAVALETLPLIVRRLDAEERRGIVPGNVYVWEERSQNNEATGLGMERWTDGLNWGPSRVRDEFLFYHQKSADADDTVSPVTPWAQMIRMANNFRKRHQISHNTTSVYPTSPTSSNNDADRLIKQTYSVHVSLPADQRRGVTRKWHLTSYFSQTRLDSLQTIDTILGVGNIQVPDGWFSSARATKRRDSRVSAPANAKDFGSPEIIQHEVENRNTPLYYYRGTPPTTRRCEQSPIDSDTFTSTSFVDNPASEQTFGLDGKLVPLAYLQNVSYPRRNPVDEQLLRMFSSHSVSSHSVTSHFVS